MFQKLKPLIRFFAFLAGTVLSLTLSFIVILGGALLWINQNPQSAFEVADKYLLPADMKFTWSNLHLQVKPVGFTALSLDLSVDDLKISKQAPALVVPIEHVQVRALVSPFERKVSVELLEAKTDLPITYKATTQTPERESDTLEQIRQGIRTLQTLGEHISFNTIDIDIEKFELQRLVGPTITAAIHLKKAMGEPAKFDLKLESPSVLAAVATGEFNADSDTTTFIASGEITHLASTPKLTILPRLTVQIQNHDATIELTADIKGIPGPLAELSDIRANLRTSLESFDKPKASTFLIAAPVRLFFVSKPNRAALEKACVCKLPERLEVKALGEVYLDTLVGASTNPRLNSNLKVLESSISVEPLENKILAIDLKGGLRVELENEPQNGERKKKFSFYPRLDISATIRSFQSLRKMLDENGFMIPAPIDIMDGTLHVTSVGPVKTDANGSKLPLNLLVDIKSKGQEIKADIHSDVTVNSRFTEAQLDVKTKISSLLLELPPLGPLDGIPRVTSDSRFKKQPAQKHSAPKFKVSFNFEVETESPTAIRLKLRYFSPYLPIDMKVRSETGRENTGFIALQPFDITYLRRTVHVEYLTLQLAGTENEPMPVKGRFRIKQTDYTIFIDVEGSSKNPFVVFSSEPYLSKNEIIHVLLFDRRSGLQPGEAETSGNVQAALADRAMGLFGIWAFASTPIKSFVYNPVTKVYSATIALSNDLTVGIGTGWETATHLELRKRVSRNWSLTAAWTPASQEEKDTAKLVLQWEKRF